MFSLYFRIKPDRTVLIPSGHWRVTFGRVRGSSEWVRESHLRKVGHCPTDPRLGLSPSEASPSPESAFAAPQFEAARASAMASENEHAPLLITDAEPAVGENRTSARRALRFAGASVAHFSPFTTPRRSRRGRSMRGSRRPVRRLSRRRASPRPKLLISPPR